MLFEKFQDDFVAQGNDVVDDNLTNDRQKIKIDLPPSSFQKKRSFSHHHNKEKSHLSTNTVKKMVRTRKEGVLLDEEGRLWVQTEKNSSIDHLDTYTITLVQKRPGPFAAKAMGVLLEVGEGSAFPEPFSRISLRDYKNQDSKSPSREVYVIEYPEKIKINAKSVSVRCQTIKYT